MTLLYVKPSEKHNILCCKVPKTCEKTKSNIHFLEDIQNYVTHFLPIIVHILTILLIDLRQHYLNS